MTSLSSITPIGILVPALVFLVGVVLATYRRRRPALAVLVGITGGLQTAQVGGVHAFCIAGLLWAVFGAVFDRRSPGAPHRAWITLACAGLLASTALTGELVNRPQLGVQLMLLAGVAALIAAFGDGDDIRKMLVGLLLVTTLAAATGVLQYLRILPHELFDGQDRPVGIYSEPDWLGLFSAIGLTLAFFRRPSTLRTTLIVVNLGALLLAAARAAWLAVVVVAVIGYLAMRFVHPARRPRGGWRIVTAAVIAGVIMLMASPTLHDFLIQRVEGAVSSDERDVSAKAREQQAAGLLQLAEDAPWHGLGLSASGRVGVSGRITFAGTADNNVASNWIVGWWVDGGLLSVPLVLLFLVAGLRRVASPTGAILMVVLVNSNFSNAMLIPIAWLGLGLCLVRYREQAIWRQTDEPWTGLPAEEVPVELDRSRGGTTLMTDSWEAR